MSEYISVDIVKAVKIEQQGSLVKIFGEHKVLLAVYWMDASATPKGSTEQWPR